MLLNFTGCAKFVECTFGHSRENVDHGINAILLITFGKADDLDAKGHESAIKKPIQEKHLA